MKKQFALAALAALVALGLGRAEAAERRFGVVEVGGSGVKASVVALEARPNAAGERVTTLRTIYDYPVENVNPAFPDQVRATATAVGRRVADLAERYDLQALRIYVVGASGLAGLAHGAALAAEVDAAVAGRGGRMRYISAEEQARYGFNGVVSCERLAHRRMQAVFVDIGSAEIIAAAAKAPAARCGEEAIAVSNFGFGVKTLAASTSADRRAPAPEAEIGRRVAEALGAGDPALRERTRIYLGGGVSWALATLTRPEDGGAYVELRAGDITRLRRQLEADPLCILDPAMAQRRDPGCAHIDIDLSQVADSERRAQASADHREIATSIYTLEELRVGLAVLEATAQALDLENRKGFFVREALRAWLLSFLLEQEAGATAPGGGAY